jgi:hypothetical protein
MIFRVLQRVLEITPCTTQRALLLGLREEAI